MVMCVLFFGFHSGVASAQSAAGSFRNHHRIVAEIRRHLANVNKPAVKSIQEAILKPDFKSVDGDVIDCVKSSQQPSFNHPALQNHSLETIPLATPHKKAKNAHRHSNETGAGFPSQLWHQSGQCPPGTVPIRRTSVKDVLQAGSMKNYMMKKNGVSSKSSRPLQQQQFDNGHEHAIGYMRGGEFYGARATLNVWSPSIEMPSEFSLSQIWVLAGSFNNDLNSIEAGWQVSPQLYGDSNPRLFIYWTDPSRGNWWMQFGEDHLVGYWPANLFTHLAGCASMLEWGGEVVNSRLGGHHTATGMGSGQFPEKGFAQASYLRNIKYVDRNNVLQTPFGLRTLAEHPKCYNIQTGVNREWGAYFYYGGPGLNADCP